MQQILILVANNTQKGYLVRRNIAYEKCRKFSLVEFGAIILSNKLNQYQIHGNFPQKSDFLWFFVSNIRNPIRYNITKLKIVISTPKNKKEEKERKKFSKTFQAES